MKDAGGQCGSRVIVALDYPDMAAALDFACQVDPTLCRMKVGKELFTRSGPVIVDKLNMAGFEVFLDLKFHDIPNTVARACAAAADLGVWMINIHALGGRHMMIAAREAIATAHHQPLLIAVTVLTSLDASGLKEIGLHESVENNVLRLARLARQAGLDGVVCSPQEVRRIRRATDDTFKLVTPGIRPSDGGADDQKRFATPTVAIQEGTDYLVIGRPITAADDPLAALKKINAEIALAQSSETC